MSYGSGEIPARGDHVKNRWEQPGTVVKVQYVPSEHGSEALVRIRWDDGGPDSPLTPAQDFTLISKQQ